MGYKSVRLLTEALNTQMEELRKRLMGVTPELRDEFALDQLNELRKLTEELAEKANRQTLEEVQALPPAQYVQAMKPLVANFHRSLMTADILPACLCEDLRANAVVLFLIGDGNTIVRASHDPSKPEVALVVEAIINGLDETMKSLAESGISEAEKMREEAPSGE
jgi:hypothetical protein